ncbi:hypothetical protein BSLA_02r0336 [Burkholderia stabilis]|nr:hypothetical protein BSLA_02r0336 [Burkholderia stabilis]
MFDASDVMENHMSTACEQQSTTRAPLDAGTRGSTAGYEKITVIGDRSSR